MLILIDTFIKFSQTFVSSNQKAITITKVHVDKRIYVYGIPEYLCEEQNPCHGWTSRTPPGNCEAK